MLSAAHRMRRSTDFVRAVRGGRRVSRRSVVVHLGRAADTADAPRVGLVVSRAVGPSVVRHQVSRRLRHLAREWVSQLPDGSLLVLRATPAAAGASSSELSGDLDAALRRALGGDAAAAVSVEGSEPRRARKGGR
jgi:ribonuclease P protein component